MNTLRLLLISLAILAAAPAAAQAPDYIANAPSADQYPGEDGLFVRQMIRVTLRADGVMETHVEESLKMFSAHLTRQNMFDPKLSWNAARGDLRVDQARTYMVDGTIVDAAHNSFVPNTPSELQWAVPYAYQRQLVVAHVGVEHDATSVTAYTVTDRGPTGLPLTGVIDLQGFVPILDQWITIEVPEGTGLWIEGLHCAVAPEVTTANGMTTYTIHRTNVPGTNTSELPDHRHGLDQLAYSVIPTWADVVNWLQYGVEAAVAPDEAIQAKTAQVLGDASFHPEKMALLHDFVVSGVRNVHWPVADFEYAARPAGQVLDSSVGHALDKAVLLTSMLRAAGFDAHVALASSQPAIAEGVAAPAQFDEIWVRVRMGERTKWLDPTTSANRHNSTTLAGHPVLVLDPTSAGVVETLPQIAADRNRGAVRVEVQVEDGGHELTLAGTADVDLMARYNPLVSFDRTAAGQQGVARKVVSGFGGASVDGVFVARQTCQLTSFRADFSGGVIEVPEHGLVQLDLPRVPGALTGTVVQSWRNARTETLVVPGGPASEHVEVAVTIPAGYEYVAGPSPTAFSNAAGSFRRDVVRDGADLTVTTNLVIEAATLSPTDWPALRALVDAADSLTGNVVLIQKSN